jgi:hypothetical protein
MKPLITITDEQIHIDDEHYTLFIRFKQQPIGAIMKPIPGEFPDTVTVIREGDKTNSLHNKKDQIKCVMCGSLFKPYRIDSKCCSEKCKKASKINKVKLTRTKSEHPLAGKPAVTGIKICPQCQKEYKPTSNVQKFCSTSCKTSFRQAEPKPPAGSTKPPIKQKATNPRAAALDKKTLAQEKKLKKLLESSPKTDDMVPVFIDTKTTIYIKPGEDVEEARRNFIDKHNQFENNQG